MRVKHSSKIFSENVSSALISYKQKSSEFRHSHATAILVMKTAKWFKVVNNSHADKALSPLNTSLFKQFQNTVVNFAHILVRGKFVKTHFLNDFPEHYKLPKSAIKPIQSFVAISSQSLLNVVNKVIEDEISKKLQFKIVYGKCYSRLC